MLSNQLGSNPAQLIAL